jgi:hypothetical protein
METILDRGVSNGVDPISAQGRVHYAVAAVFYLSCGGFYTVSPFSLFRGIALEHKGRV